MRVERQGRGECVLATIAALAEVSLQEVREVACAAMGVSEWSEIVTPARVDRFIKGVRAAVRHFQVRGIPSTHYLVAGDQPRIKQTLPKKGRGSIIVQSGGHGSHIAPFEDGLVYNPTEPDYPQTLEAYLANHPGWEVVKITVARKSRRRPTVSNLQKAPQNRREQGSGAEVVSGYGNGDEG